jgi:hypothetical protein
LPILHEVTSPAEKQTPRTPPPPPPPPPPLLSSFLPQRKTIFSFLLLQNFSFFLLLKLSGKKPPPKTKKLPFSFPAFYLSYYSSSSSPKFQLQERTFSKSTPTISLIPRKRNNATTEKKEFLFIFKRGRKGEEDTQTTRRHTREDTRTQKKRKEGRKEEVRTVP